MRDRQRAGVPRARTGLLAAAIMAAGVLINGWLQSDFRFDAWAVGIGVLCVVLIYVMVFIRNR